MRQALMIRVARALYAADNRAPTTDCDYKTLPPSMRLVYDRMAIAAYEVLKADGIDGDTSK